MSRDVGVRAMLGEREPPSGGPPVRVLMEMATFQCRDRRSRTTCNDRGQEAACESCLARRWLAGNP